MNIEKITYNQYETLNGKPYKVCAFNQMNLQRIYPIEINPINVAWITAGEQIVRMINTSDFKTINIGPAPMRFSI